LAPGLEAWAEIYDPSALDICTVHEFLIASSMMIVTLNHATERDTSSEHPLAHPKKGVDQSGRNGSCALDMKCGPATFMPLNVVSGKH
jgi:hypothetical protein